MMNEEVAQGLANAIIRYIRLKRDQKEEKFLKDKAKKNKQGEFTNGAINERLVMALKNHGVEDVKIKEITKLKREKDQTNLELQKQKFERLLVLCREEVDQQDVHGITSEYQAFLERNDSEHQPVVWLNQWVEKAKDISFATHVGKLTHSSSKGSSILDTTTSQDNCYLTTNSLSNPELDTASANAASLPVAEVLKLTVDGYTVIDCLKSGDVRLLEIIADNRVLAQNWFDNLKQAYDSSKKQSYFLSKQTYFPVGRSQYHLLLPLTSSSLVHAMFLEHKKYFDEEQTFARGQKANKKYSIFPTCQYPNKASLNVTGSNHSNASSLNGKRGGRISLLPTFPPEWRRKSVSYTDKSSVFDRWLAYELSTEISELKKYLLLLKNKKLSKNEPKRNAAVIAKLENISGRLFDYIESVNLHTNEEGWTLNSTLPAEQQLLFEPWRQDDAALSMKKNDSWQKELSQQYGVWLNRELNKDTKLALTPIQSAFWSNVFANELREYVATWEEML